MAISMLKIRRPLGRLIFNMGIAIPGKTVFLIETAPRFLHLLYSYHYIRVELHVGILQDIKIKDIAQIATKDTVQTTTKKLPMK